MQNITFSSYRQNNSKQVTPIKFENLDDYVKPNYNEEKKVVEKFCGAVILSSLVYGTYSIIKKIEALKKTLPFGKM